MTGRDLAERTFRAIHEIRFQAGHRFHDWVPLSSVVTVTGYGCPVEFTLSALGGKWKTVLLAHLKTGPKRYRDLRSLVPGLSEKMLTRRLQELEASGFIEKQPKEGSLAFYVLTEAGRSLGPVLQALYDWGEARMG